MFWRQVLAALADDTLDAAEREATVARGAAQLAVHRRASEGQQPTPEAVMDVAFHEFNLLLTAEQARTALSEVGRGRGWPPRRRRR